MARRVIGVALVLIAVALLAVSAIQGGVFKLLPGSTESNETSTEASQAPSPTAEPAPDPVEHPAGSVESIIDSTLTVTDTKSGTPLIEAKPLYNGFVTLDVLDDQGRVKVFPAPGFFYEPGLSVLPQDISKGSLVIVGHSADEKLPEQDGPFSFLNDLPEGPQSGSQTITVSNKTTGSNLVCRSDNVEKRPSDLATSEYLDNTPFRVVLITCARKDGVIDFTRSTVLRGTCLGV